MTAPWLDSKTPVGPPASANPTLRQLLYAGVVTGAWSGVACLVLYLLGRIVGLGFEVKGAGQGLQAVPWPVVLLLPLAAGVACALLASLIRGWPHAGRIAYWAGTIVALVSLAGPLGQPESVTWPTRILLALMHVVTWILVVPQIARIVGDSEPGRSVERDEQS